MSIIPERPGPVRIQALNAEGTPEGAPFEARGEIRIQGMYSRLTPIRVLGRDDTVIYEGAGEVQWTCGPGSEGRTALHLEEDGYAFRWDLTEWSLRYGVSMDRVYSQAPFIESWDPQPGEMLRIPDPPRVVSVTVRIDIAPSSALALRDEILQSHPSRQLTGQDVRDAMDRMRQRYLDSREVREPDRYDRGMIDLEAVQAAFSNAAARAGEGLSAFADVFRDQDRLMKETRSEFPYDPYQYGLYNPEGPSRWTPPEDPDEKVRSCP